MFWKENSIRPSARPRAGNMGREGRESDSELAQQAGAAASGAFYDDRAARDQVVEVRRGKARAASVEVSNIETMLLSQDTPESLLLVPILTPCLPEQVSDGLGLPGGKAILTFHVCVLSIKHRRPLLRPEKRSAAVIPSTSPVSCGGLRWINPDIRRNAAPAPRRPAPRTRRVPLGASLPVSLTAPIGAEYPVAFGRCLRYILRSPDPSLRQHCFRTSPIYSISTRPTDRLEVSAGNQNDTASANVSVMHSPRFASQITNE